MPEKAQPAIHDTLERLDVTSLIPYTRNSRTHSKAHVRQLANSIREYGFTNPVLIDEYGTIIAGHGRVLAAQRLGMVQVPCLRLSGLTADQKRAYVIADNKLALNAGWNNELLAMELSELSAGGYDIGIVGFNQDELVGLMGEEESATPPPPPKKKKEKPPKVHCCPGCGLEFTEDGPEQ